VVGVPVRTEPAKLSPGGRFGDEKVYGALPPAAPKVWEYGTPVEALGNVDAVARPNTWSEKGTLRVLGGFCESVTLIVNVIFPGCAGVPTNPPVTGFRVSPAGRFTADQVYGAVPPVAENVVETLDPSAISPDVPALLIERTEGEIVSDNGTEVAVPPPI
jgi:hypothetical protein